MCLVDDEDLPVDGAKRCLVNGHQLVRRQQNVKLDTHVLLHTKRLAAAADCTLLKRELVLSALYTNKYTQPVVKLKYF